MLQLIKTTLKTGIVLFVGFFLMALRPSLAMVLEKSQPMTLANFYFREAVAFAIAVVILIIAIIVAGRGKYDVFGFARPANFRALKPILIALIAGAGSTALGSLFGLEGPQIIGDMTFPQIVVAIWIIASIYEELVVRGFIQGTLDLICRDKVAFHIRSLSFPVIISGLFFGLSHLMLFSVGATAGFVVIVVIFATVIGLAAAHYKEKTGSLLPAILIHMLANIAGTVAGYLVD